MDEQFTMVDEDGSEYTFDILSAKEREGTVYLMAAEAGEEEEAEIIHLRGVSTEGDEMTFDLVEENDDDYEWVLDLFHAEYEELGVETE